MTDHGAITEMFTRAGVEYDNGFIRPSIKVRVPDTDIIIYLRFEFNDDYSLSHLEGYTEGR